MFVGCRDKGDVCGDGGAVDVGDCAVGFGCVYGIVLIVLVDGS